MAEINFGTDGVRGQYDQSGRLGAINEETFERLAYASVQEANQNSGDSSKTPLFIIGGDTRSSSSSLIEAASDGAMFAGAEVWNIDTAPTPVIAKIAQNYGASAIAITASHNPDGHNGFKLFQTGGIKANRETLDSVEYLFSQLKENDNLSNYRGKVRLMPHLKDEYFGDIISTFGWEDSFEGKTIVVDAANGAAHELAPRIYRELGANVIEFACDPNQPINKGCGAANLSGVTEFLRDNPELTNDPNFLAAIAHDGDADRVMALDRFGRILNGNHWMWQLAIDEPGIVGTKYTNGATRQAIIDSGTKFYECENGDSNVTQKLNELNSRRTSEIFRRGGEFTGHLIDLDHLSSGDGIYMAAWLAARSAQSGLSFEAMHENLPLWPERLENIHVDGIDPNALLDNEHVQEVLVEAKKIANILPRASGTEPVIRVWAEAKELERVNFAVNSLVKAIRSQLVLQR